MWSETNYDDAAAKDICYNCGSATAKKSYNFFRRMIYVSGNKIWAKIWYYNGRPVAFYFANCSKKHVRLIEIAVKSDLQKKGLGRKLCYRLFSQMQEHNINKLTFRTPMNEDAQYFWNKMGAKIVDVKGEDYEMEINFN